MTKTNQPNNPDEEYFVFAIPGELEEDDGEELVFSVLPYDQGIAILDAERLRNAGSVQMEDAR